MSETTEALAQMSPDTVMQDSPLPIVTARRGMTDNLVKVGPPVTPEQLDLVRRTVANGATPDELKLYLYDCARQGVHPLDKLLHYTKRNGKYTPVTSIDLMRTRAADTGEYAGSDDASYGYAADGEPPPNATVSVWRLVQGQRYAFTATARWTEYCPDPGPSGKNDLMWRRMPYTMLGKCAEALALRKGFPRQLAGLYAKEELDQANGSTPVTVITPEPPATVIDTTTGAEVAASDKPEAPEGYRYIDRYWQEGDWHHVEFLKMNAQGGAMSFKTKLTRVGEVACHAFQDGVPVKIETKPNARDLHDEGWLQKVTMWKKPADDELVDSRELAAEAF